MPSDSVAFDRAAGYYDQTRGFPAGEQHAIVELIAKIAGFTPATRLLEIGIGTGRIALPLAPHVGEIVGIDLARPMMERLRTKQAGEAIRLVQADATRLPFAGAAFDAAIAVHVFHLMAGWRQALQEITRVLKPGGVLVRGQNWRKTGSEEFKSLTDAWEAVIPPAESRRPGVEADQEDTFLTDLGWHRVGERHTHRFRLIRTPRQHFEAYEKRIWSNTWLIRDEQHQAGMEALRRAMEAHYPNPDQPLEIETGFDVEVFTPPEYHG